MSGLLCILQMSLQPDLYFVQPRFLGSIQLLIGYVMQQGCNGADEHIRPFHTGDQCGSITYTVRMEPVMPRSIQT